MANQTTYAYNYPFAKADNLTIANQTAAQTFTITNGLSILETAAGAPLTFSTAAITISASNSLVKGAVIQIAAAASGTTSTITLSGDIYTGTLAPTTGTTASISYFYDGTKFYPQGTVVIH